MPCGTLLAETVGVGCGSVRGLRVLHPDTRGQASKTLVTTPRRISSPPSQVVTQQSHCHQIPATPLPRSCLRNSATFSVSHSTSTMDHSAIAAPRSQSHHLSVGGSKGRFGPQPQRSTPYTASP